MWLTWLIRNLELLNWIVLAQNLLRSCSQYVDRAAMVFWRLYRVHLIHLHDCGQEASWSHMHFPIELPENIASSSPQKEWKGVCGRSYNIFSWLSLQSRMPSFAAILHSVEMSLSVLRVGENQSSPLDETNKWFLEVFSKSYKFTLWLQTIYPFPPYQGSLKATHCGASTWSSESFCLNQGRCCACASSA